MLLVVFLIKPILQHELTERKDSDGNEHSGWMNLILQPIPEQPLGPSSSTTPLQKNIREIADSVQGLDYHDILKALGCVDQNMVSPAVEDEDGMLTAYVVVGSGHPAAQMLE